MAINLLPFRKLDPRTASWKTTALTFAAVLHVALLLSIVFGVVEHSRLLFIRKGYDPKRAAWEGIHKLGFIHIGKCGGVSAKQTIMDTSLTNNEIVKRGVRSYHMDPPPALHVGLLQDWMITIRNPIARIQSNWIYSHPANNPYRRDHTKPAWRQTLLYQCYSSLDDAATNGLVTPVNTVTENRTSEDYCPSVLRRVIVGELEDDQLIHFRRNYRYHLTPLLKNDEFIQKKNIYAVRAEHMLEDLNSINQAFGASGDVFSQVKNYDHFWNVSTNTPALTTNLPYNNRTVSPEGMAHLCWILCDEIQIYKRVLELAKNLREDEKEESLQQLAQQCPQQAQSNLICPMRTRDDWIRNGIPSTAAVVASS